MSCTVLPAGKKTDYNLREHFHYIIIPQVKSSMLRKHFITRTI